mgnify:CR=1 FL=1
MNILKKFWNYLHQDSWHSWLVSIIIIIILIKFIFFPILSLITGSPLPLVVVESCSMYHESSFDSWWEKNAPWYESKSIFKKDFSSFPIKNGLNKGDIVLLWGRSTNKIGNIIIFEANTQHPLIHRVISLSPLSTKGDHNSDQLQIEKDISQNAVIGKAIAKIPLIGWVKLIFFEPLKSPDQRGFCR